MLKKIAIITILLVSTICMYLPSSSLAKTQLPLNEQVIGEFVETEPYEIREYVLTIPEEGLLTVQMNKVEHDYRLGFFKDNISFALVDATDPTLQIVLKAGTYRVLMSVEESTTYDFTLVFEPGMYADAEPNNNLSEARSIQEGELVKGFTALGYPYSNDVYAITIQDPATLTLKQKNAKLRLVTDDNTAFLTQTKAETTEAEINIKPGQYYIIAEGGDYTFSYALSKAQPMGELLPNHSIELANLLTPGQQVNGQLRDGQIHNDFYKISLKEDSEVQLNITGEDMMVRLSDATGKQFTSDSYTKDYRINLRKGEYYIELYSSMKQNYAMILQTKAVQHVSFEPNNDFKTAQTIELGRTIDVTSTNSHYTNDVFKIDIPAPGIFKIEKAHSGMSVTLYDENEQDIGLYNNKVYDEIGVTKGTYYVKLSMSKSGSFKPTFTPTSVEYEENDSRLNAQPLQMNKKLRGYITHKSDKDVFTISVPKKDVYSFEIPTIETEFSTPTLTIMKGDDIIFQEQVTGPAMPNVELEAGDYFVILEGFSALIYELTWSGKSVKPFKDVPITHRYYQEIMALNQLQVINGYENGTFKPTDNIKRHHAAAMLVRSKAPAIPLSISYKFFFKDVPRLHPNFENIHKLADVGIVAKSSNGFNPNGMITRAQMAKMLVLAFELEQQATPQSFHDVAPEAWYKEYVDILASHGITTGANGYFKPNEPLTRQHFAAFLYRTLQVK